MKQDCYNDNIFVLRPYCKAHITDTTSFLTFLPTRGTCTSPEVQVPLVGSADAFRAGETF